MWDSSDVKYSFNFNIYGVEIHFPECLHNNSCLAVPSTVQTINFNIHKVYHVYKISSQDNTNENCL